MDLEKMEQDARTAKDSRSYTDGAAFVDGRFLPVGEPGPVTRQLRDAYRDLHDDPRFSLPVHYD
jgi:hypothetical protein